MLGLTLMFSCEGSCWAVVSTSRLKSERMRRTVSEPIAIANAHRIVNVSSAETPARRVRIGSRSNVAVSFWTTRRGALRKSSPLADPVALGAPMPVGSDLGLRL